MTSTTSTATTKSTAGRWFFCDPMSKGKEIAVWGKLAARKVGEGYEVYGDGSRTVQTLTAAQAVTNLKSERSKGAVMFLNASEVADVSRGAKISNG